MKKIIIAVILLAAASGGGWYYYSKNRKTADTVKYAEVKAEVSGISEFIETTGEVAPRNRVEIKPSAGGRIEELLAEEGDRIRPGQVLALMSSADRVAILDAAIALGQDQYKKWKDTYKPIKVISPIGGTVILRNTVPGETVSGGTALFAISDNLIIAANVDESDIGRVKVGQKAEIVLDAYPDKKVIGRVFQILDEGKNQSNVITYQIKIKPEKVPDFYKSAMTANVKIEVASERDALLVPSPAISVPESGKTSVITGFEKKKPVYTAVELGLSQGNYTEIVSGLKEGDKVFVSELEWTPQQQLESGSPLTPKRPGKGMPRGARRAIRGR